ncbi:hypothetical protein AVHY2522_22925 [Acidovorax sp. SUPP2522]|uniref:hypothetical protein n=1 Tax=unclassified Acidovorax TaxID=2684926 RepID=UPI002349BF42|nr:MULTISPECIES: hypothetical protein [unclassified Acidovorax]WCM95719.1 hypothetical protein M5C96_14650 [Acidovorax sp. GBBC 1281]GKT19559.1 hypothetical protein AVHY2522_22925 [Acidovorax sp. SUPP2522]
MSSSNSRSEATTWQQDNRRVIGEHGVSAEGGSTVNYTVNSLDKDVVNRAFDYGRDVSRDAFDFGRDALDFGSDALGFASDSQGRAYGLAGSALDTVNDALANSLDFGKYGIRAMADANADALGFASDNANRYATINANLYADALASNSDAVKSVLTLGGGLLSDGFSMIGATNNLVKDAYADAKGRGALTDKMIMAAIAAMAIVAFMAVRK